VGECIEERVRGFLAFCGRCPQITSEVCEVNGDGHGSSHGAVLSHVLRRHLDLRGIFVTNASTHPAAAYIKSRSTEGKIHVIGYDLIDENIRYLREGVIDFLISQQPERQGYEGITALYRHVVLKEAVPKQVMMQIDIVTSENVDFFRS
jgi:LacI family transcriptional regulator